MFEIQIREWFQEKSSEDVKKLDKLCMAFPDGDAETIEDLFNDYLWNTISIRDTAVQGKKRKFLSWSFAWTSRYMKQLGCQVKYRIRNWLQ